ncbi:hypothetical protein [Anaerobranca gottschalkii]|uniref:Uncharacterized protein n=1 Tax=Anaerobranca gottschalkii DSM 13577 TaxID=1120990 RepID=A0A1H9YNC3_9FIRM|nr:hypothetical protein [Anaerobranca gottschalkii]SES70619.1 hypothetical protein SAMN03080614_100428 [Anaerobranca gottschalkii DSM 13577]
MSKKIIFLLVFLVISSLLLAFINKNTSFPSDETLIYPWSYSIDVSLESTDEDSFVTIGFLMLKNYPNSKNTDPNLIIEARLSSPITVDETTEKDYVDPHLSIAVSVKDIEKIGKTKVDSKEVYLYNLFVNIPRSTNFVFEDAYLELTYISGIKEKIYIGDLAFFNVQSIFYEVDHCIQKTRALVALNELWEITALIIEFNVKDNVVLEAFNFSLPKFGIDQENVVVLKEPLDRVEDLYLKRELDKEFPNIYEMAIVEQPTKALNVELHQGVNTVIIPFTKSTADFVPKIKVLGGLFTYLKENEQFIYPLESLEYFLISPFENLEELIPNDWK